MLFAMMCEAAATADAVRSVHANIHTANNLAFGKFLNKIVLCV